MLTITISSDYEEIKAAVECCDASLPRGITCRNDYNELLDKFYKNAICIIAYQESIVGYAVMYANDTDSLTAYISIFVIKKENQRQHIGKEIMNACKEIAKSKGMNHIRLEVLSDNKNAISFYLHHGFVHEKNCSPSSIYMICSISD